jgi:hypothetical protein
MHRTVNGYNTIWDHSLLTAYQTDLNSDFRLNIDAGVNSQERLYEQNGQRSTQQLVYGLFDHDNFINHDNFNEGGGRIDFKSRTLSLGAFAQGLLSYKDRRWKKQLVIQPGAGQPFNLLSFCEFVFLAHNSHRELAEQPYP